MNELAVLGIVSERLVAAGLSFMLTGSFAMAYYATPRMTRGIDLVVELQAGDLAGLVAAIAGDFYVDAAAAAHAVESERLFNMMHFASGIKIAIIVRKADEYRRLEFERRYRVNLAGVPTWIVTREDLILSKLVWARDGASELQVRDVRALFHATLDNAYLRRWAEYLGVVSSMDEIFS